VKSSRASLGFHAPTCAFALLNRAFTLPVEEAKHQHCTNMPSEERMQSLGFPYAWLKWLYYLTKLLSSKFVFL
jgi:hypothetical protein